jgi:hypothetical protein
MHSMKENARTPATDNQGRKTDLDPLLWTIAAAIAGAIVYLVYSL